MMAHGKIETRTWATKVRGPVLICASMKPYELHELQRISADFQLREMQQILGRFKHLPNGVALGIAELYDCKPMRHREQAEMAFTKFDHNLWCHYYRDFKPCFPFRFKGGQRWLNLDPKVNELIIHSERIY